MQSLSRKAAALLKPATSVIHSPLNLIPHSRSIILSRVLCNLPPVTMATSKVQMADRLKGTDQNVWVVFGKMAVDYKATNLGQGFPDFLPPQYMRDSLKDIMAEDNPLINQYTRSFGHPRLVQALANVFSPQLGRKIDPMNEILVSVGAYGALFCCVQGLVNPGDEVIIIEPYFDCYEPMVRVAGGTPVFVPLRPPKQAASNVTSSADWKLDPQELASKFNSKTKAIFFNTPNNPLGKIYTRDEMQMIADLCIQHDVVVFADEVYEWMVYDENKHIKMATLPGMWDRTITVGSAGKTFSVTGWKLGWSIGPPHLLRALQTMHQNCSYTCPTPLQEGVARGFELELSRLSTDDCYFKQLPAELVTKRDRMSEVLSAVGMKPVLPQGGYFMMCDYSNIDFPEDKQVSDEPRDYKFIKWMTKNKRLTAIPPSAFYSAEHKHLGEGYIRFCFCKEDATLEQAYEILNNWSS